jgi:hypothetical protein
VLEEPGAHNVRRYFGKDAPFLLTFLAPVVIVIVACPVTGADAGIAQE